MLSIGCSHRADKENCLICAATNPQEAKELQTISFHLENISNGINHRPEFTFLSRVAHILTSVNLISAEDQIFAIKTLYFMMAWPERELSDKQKSILERI